MDKTRVVSDPQDFDPQDVAEALDAGELGEDDYDPDELPGVNSFTDDDHRLNAEDPAIILDADTEAVETLAERDWRTEDEDRPASGGIRLADSDSDEPTFADDEKDLVTPFSELVDDDELSAEEAAMHLEEG